MLAVFVFTVRLPGFLSRIAILLALIFGYVLSWVLDKTAGPITSLVPATGEVASHDRVSFQSVLDAPWFGLPQFHGPDFKIAAIVLVRPAVIALIAENPRPTPRTSGLWPPPAATPAPRTTSRGLSRSSSACARSSVR